VAIFLIISIEIFLIQHAIDFWGWPNCFVNHILYWLWSVIVCLLTHIRYISINWV